MNRTDKLTKLVIKYSGVYPTPSQMNKDESIPVYHSGDNWFHYSNERFYKSEFENHATILGYINGFRWGVEYLVNGKKPDLPSDLIVVVKNKINSFWFSNTVSTTAISSAHSFKIIDQRYKPADTSYLVKKAMECVDAIEERLTSVDQRILNNVSVDEIEMAKREFAAMSPAFQDLMQESFDKVIADMEEKRKVAAEKKKQVVDDIIKLLELKYGSPKSIYLDYTNHLYDLGYFS